MADTLGTPKDIPFLCGHRCRTWAGITRLARRSTFQKLRQAIAASRANAGSSTTDESVAFYDGFIGHHEQEVEVGSEEKK
ncbi:hypothetical protein E2562_015127 [Oryza meyeriana var. granulata]|uniref:Uncharacterized protein n=1 Tax=Oryza meyeriana var. granulata TaxID=110450 RepID=A0A6G1DX24_9ORYZ|nr:hypothetical protein E2562_015127 [Oryza meyeriana var. granulata]